MSESRFSDDEMEFHQANQAARALGIETWEHHWRRWRAKPADSGRWFHVVSQVNGERLPQVLQAAESTIDLAAIATGPSDELGLGSEYENHSCLDYLLQELLRFPGCGAVFIEAGLKSPVVRNRNMAIAALAEWQSDDRVGSQCLFRMISPDVHSRDVSLTNLACAREGHCVVDQRQRNLWLERSRYDISERHGATIVESS